METHLIDIEKVREVVVQALLDARVDARQKDYTKAVTDETPLGDAGLAVNSLTLIRTLMIIEDRLDITLEEAVVTGAKFERVGEIIELASLRLGQ